MQQKSVHLVRAGNIAPSVKEQSHGTEDESEISFRYESTMKWLRICLNYESAEEFLFI